MTKARVDTLSWWDYFMSVAVLSAQRSKDPNTQVGSCIVDTHNRIVATGYNGFPRGISSDALPWDRVGEFLKTKYAYVCHAEANAVYNRGANSVEDSTIFCTLHPCHECAKAIIQSGITTVVYLSDKYKETDSHKAAVEMFNMCNVETYQHSIQKNLFKEELW